MEGGTFTFRGDRDTMTQVGPELQEILGGLYHRDLLVPL